MNRVHEGSIGECSDPPPKRDQDIHIPILRLVKSQTSYQAKPPFSILLTTLLYCGECAAACVMCVNYSRSDDRFWLLLTILFMLVPAVMDQLTLIFVHRDLTSDKPMIFFMHLLLLGPIIR